MQIAIRRGVDDELQLDPDLVIGASRDVDGVLHLDPENSGGLIVRNADGTISVHSTAWADTQEVTLTASLQPVEQHRVMSRVISFAATISRPADAIQRTVLITRSYAATLQLLQPTRLVQIVRSYSATLSSWVQRTVQINRSYTTTLTHLPRKIVQLIRSFTSNTTFKPSGVTRLSEERAAAVAEATYDSVLRGRRGMIPLTYRIALSNIRGEDRGTLPGVVGAGQLSMSNARAHAFEVSFEMIDMGQIDPVRDYIKVYADLEVNDQTRSYPLGLYRCAKPSGLIRQSGSTITMQGFSLEYLLERDEAYLGLSVPAGTDVLKYVRQVLINHGIPNSMILFPPEAAILLNTQQFDPVGASTNMSWLSICNTLLNAAGYYALQCDADGKWVTLKMGSQTVIRPEINYDGAYENFVVGDVRDDWNDDAFANRIVVRSQDVADTPPLVGVAENRNPDSHGSYPFLGYWVQKNVTLQTGNSQAVLDTMAQAELQKASGYYRKLGLSTLFDHRVFYPRKIYGLSLFDELGDEVVGGVWNQINVSLQLSNPATPMTHEVSRIEKV